MKTLTTQVKLKKKQSLNTTDRMTKGNNHQKKKKPTATTNVAESWKAERIKYVTVGYVDP